MQNRQEKGNSKDCRQTCMVKVTNNFPLSMTKTYSVIPKIIPRKTCFFSQPSKHSDDNIDLYF